MTSQTFSLLDFEEWWNNNFNGKLGTFIIEEAFKEVALKAMNETNTDDFENWWSNSYKDRLGFLIIENTFKEIAYRAINEVTEFI